MRVPLPRIFLCLLPDYASSRYFASRPAYAQATTTGAPPTSSTQTWGVIIIGVSNQRRPSVFVGGERRQAFRLHSLPWSSWLPPIGFNPESAGERRGPIAQFVHVPAGELQSRVSAAGYKPAVEHTEVLQSVTNRVQYVYVYLHPESELGTGARPAVVPDKALKEIDKGIAAMQNSTTPKR